MKVTFLNHPDKDLITLTCFRIEFDYSTIRGYDADYVPVFDVDIDYHKGRPRFHIYPPHVPSRRVRQKMVVQSDNDRTPA